MNKKLLIALAFVVVLIAAFYWLRPARNAAPQQHAALPAQIASLALTGAQNGIATISDDEGLVDVQYGFIDAPEGVAQPAYIYSGTCAKLGSVTYLLDVPKDGISLTSLDVSLSSFKAQLPLAIAVHKSLDDMAEYVACADIVL